MTKYAYKHPEAIVTTEWLADNLDAPHFRIYDCTTYLRYTPRAGKPYDVESGRADYDLGHIPNSAFLDLQADLSDNQSPYRFTVLPPVDLARRFAGHGIGDQTRVILYSRANMQWATRVWWMLRYVGFDNAAVLDGGWDAWTAEQRPQSAEPVTYPPAQLTPAPRSGLFVGSAATQAAIGASDFCTINALAPDLHSGTNDRYGRRGRIPGSVNVPAGDLQPGPAKQFASPDVAAARFAAVGADTSKNIIIYCGGGIAATLDAFLLHQLGYENLAVYDASMSEWATRDDLPIETD